jgi:hypothetical protein
MVNFTDSPNNSVARAISYFITSFHFSTEGIELCEGVGEANELFSWRFGIRLLITPNNKVHFQSFRCMEVLVFQCEKSDV